MIACAIMHLDEVKDGQSLCYIYSCSKTKLKCWEGYCICNCLVYPWLQVVCEAKTAGWHKMLDCSLCMHHPVSYVMQSQVLVSRKFTIYPQHVAGACCSAMALTKAGHVNTDMDNFLRNLNRCRDSVKPSHYIIMHHLLWSLHCFQTLNMESPK